MPAVLSPPPFLALDDVAVCASTALFLCPDDSRVMCVSCLQLQIPEISLSMKHPNLCFLLGGQRGRTYRVVSSDTHSPDSVLFLTFA